MKNAKSRVLGGAAVAALAAACAPVGLPGTAVGSTTSSGGAVRLAPDDMGDPARHHDYVMAAGDAQSTFVWIPRFQAYQLLRPAGAGHPGKPIGFWVKEQPAGQEGDDWARQSFGGFYAAKYEASKAAGGVAASQAGAVPWNDVTWGEARAASEAIAPGRSHLLRGDEWTALAVWSLIHGVAVRGNTLFGQDAADAALAWENASQSGPAATGTGRDARWDASTNLTSHTGGPDGVLDLVGNVQEWDGALAMRGYDLEIDGASTGLGGTLPGYVATLHTDAQLRRFGVAGTTQAAPNPALTLDFFTDFFHGGGLVSGGGHGAATGASTGVSTGVSTGASTGAATGAAALAAPQLLRGSRGGSFDRGHHEEPAQAGMWLVCLNRDDTYRSAWMGFRAAMSF